jgi:hypothetical protein
MDEVQNPSDLECGTSSSEQFRFHMLLYSDVITLNKRMFVGLSFQLNLIENKSVSCYSARKLQQVMAVFLLQLHRPNSLRLFTCRYYA